MMRVPLDPLLEYLKVRYQEEAEIENISWLSRQFGVNRETVYAWLKKGIDWKQADYQATKLVGTHPRLLWPEWCDAADEAVAERVRRHPELVKEPA